MSIGYACLTVGVKNTALRTCILKNADNDRLMEISLHNINSLHNIIEYNIRRNIRLFRISSDIIPFASSTGVSFPWQQYFSGVLGQIGQRAKENNIRLSMHPGQYTVLNSPNTDVVKRAVLDLEYHCAFLDAMGTGSDSKIILHIGGVYGNKKESASRFISNFSLLNDSLRRRIALENDDKMYNIEDVLEIATRLSLPVVFDNLHHSINKCSQPQSEAYWINQCYKTWKKTDGPQKIHYSQQDPMKKVGSHSSTINLEEFLDFYRSALTGDMDIMLEVKDKNLSAVKCILATWDKPNIGDLEREWGRYKYSVLERSPNNYLKIRQLLKKKGEYPCIALFSLIDSSLMEQTDTGRSLNALEHIWGYFKHKATDKEKKDYFNIINKLKGGRVSLPYAKKFLLNLAIKYHEDYLLDSYYFDL